MATDQRKRKYEAPEPGTRYGRLTVTEENDVYREIGKTSKYTKRCAVLACDCGGSITVSHSNLRWAKYQSCTKCPYFCRYCGNTDTSFKMYEAVSHCKSCDAAFRHKVPWDTYVTWKSAGCMICGSSKSLHIDHAHTCCGPRENFTCGNCNRGLLCSTHNQLVGYYELGMFEGVENYVNKNKLTAKQ